MTHQSATFNSWKAMLARCTDTRHHKYHLYGARGIKVFPTWFDFRIFLADMGPRPSGHTIDRIRNDGNYEPGNCKWSTPTEQNRNKRVTKRFMHQGLLYTAAELYEKFPCTVELSALVQRLCSHDWSVIDALTIPPGKHTQQAILNIRESHQKHADCFCIKGVKMTSRQIHEKFNSVVSVRILRKRLMRGWSLEDSVSVSPQKSRHWR